MRPFGNVVFTVSISGAELKTFLENGVSLMPSAACPVVTPYTETVNMEVLENKQ